MLIWLIPFFIVTLPFCIWAAWSDLKFLKIPNILTLGLFLAFVIVGIFVLPFDDYLWRLLVGLIALAVGFLVYFTGLMGGGDLKLIAAMLPFVARTDLLQFAFIASVMTLAGIASHRLVGKTRFAPEDWTSWKNDRRYPFGLSLGGALIFYFVLSILEVIAVSGTTS